MIAAGAEGRSLPKHSKTSEKPPPASRQRTISDPARSDQGSSQKLRYDRRSTPQWGPNKATLPLKRILPNAALTQGICTSQQAPARVAAQCSKKVEPPPRSRLCARSSRSAGCGCVIFFTKHTCAEPCSAGGVTKELHRSEKFTIRLLFACPGSKSPHTFYPELQDGGLNADCTSNGIGREPALPDGLGGLRISQSDRRAPAHGIGRAES